MPASGFRLVVLPFVPSFGKVSQQSSYHVCPSRNSSLLSLNKVTLCNLENFSVLAAADASQWPVQAIAFATDAVVSKLVKSCATTPKLPMNAV
eukprot:1611138-Amphidinium_carterae.1